MIDPDTYLFPLEVNFASYKAERILFIEEAIEKNLSSKSRALYLLMIGLELNQDYFNEEQINDLCRYSGMKRRTLFKYMRELADAKLTTIAKRIRMLHTLN